MPLLDHFHPPLHGPRRWEGFHHSWATYIATHLNQHALPADYYAESEIRLKVWSPPKPKISAKVDFAHLDSYEVRVYQDLGGAQLRGAIELVSPGNRVRAGARRTFAAKCAGYIKLGIGVIIVDVVTARSANLHKELFDVLEVVCSRAMWSSPTGLYAVAYRPVTERKGPRVEAWPEALALGKPLPTLPLWLSLELCVPVRLEESYVETCRSLRISA